MGKRATSPCALRLTAWTVAVGALAGVVSAAQVPPTVVAQQGTESPAVTPGTAPIEVEPPAVWAAPTTLDRSGRIMAAVLVNGRGPFRFVVDTGASRSALAPHVAAELGLAPDPDHMVSLRGVTGVEEVPSVLVEELRAGDLVMERQRLPLLRPSVFADADGILGTEGLEEMCLQVMFAWNEVEIHRGRCPRSRFKWLHVRAAMRDNRLITVRARLGGQRITAIVDTGAESSLGNLALLNSLESGPQALRPAKQAIVTGATEHSVPGRVVVAPTISLGDMNITNLSVIFGDFEAFRIWQLEDTPALLLGMDVLGTVDGIKIDYRRQQIHILASGAGSAADAASRVEAR